MQWTQYIVLLENKLYLGLKSWNLACSRTYQCEETYFLFWVPEFRCPYQYIGVKIRLGISLLVLIQFDVFYTFFKHISYLTILAIHNLGHLRNIFIRTFWFTVQTTLLLFSGFLYILFLMMRLQGSTNCAHDYEHARKVVFACTELHARKSIKTHLISTWMLYKVTSCLCVWKPIIFGTTKSDIHNFFQLRSCC